MKISDGWTDGAVNSLLFVRVQLTVERHPEEEPVGNVHHDGPQQVESVHVSGGVRHLLQTFQVFDRGTQADPHRPAEAGARQSCNDPGPAFVLHSTHLQVVSLNPLCFSEVYLLKVLKIVKHILCPSPELWALTFSEISPDFPPELDVAVEDDSSSLHPDTLQPSSAPEPGRVVGAPQDVVDGGGPAPSGLMELLPPCRG